MACTAPVCWWKYTTTALFISPFLFLFFRRNRERERERERERDREKWSYEHIQGFTAILYA